MTTFRQSAARKICDLLDHVEHVLHFYTVSGREGIDCSREALDMIKQWDRPGCLAPGKSTAGKEGCDHCPLFSPGRSPIAGCGPEPARLMVISDVSMGQNPFSGNEGELLGKIIVAMGLTPEQVYLTAMVRCGTPEGRKVDGRALAACRPFLEAEIRRVAPKVIWVLGEKAAHAFLDVVEPMGRLHGRFYDRQGIQVMATWHPRDILSDPSLKRPVWDDVQQIMKTL